jgi:hypothetical protein
VVVAVTTDLVVDAVQDQRLVLEGRERLQDRLEVELACSLIGKNSFGNVPFGENMMITRWRRLGSGAPVRLGSPARKGSAAAETPRERRN